MNRTTLLTLLTNKFPDLLSEVDNGSYLTVHIQLAAGQTGRVAVELYRGLTSNVSESWGLTLPAHTASLNRRGMFVFLVAREGGKTDRGWTYDVYTLPHHTKGLHSLAITNDGDRLVKLFDVDTLYNVGEIVLNLPGYTPQSKE